MAKLIKLTRKNNTSGSICYTWIDGACVDHSNVLTWGEGVSHEVKKDGKLLCSNQVIHAFETIELASLFSCFYTAKSFTVAWDAEGVIEVNEDGKVGVKKLTTLKKSDQQPFELPDETINKRLEAILLRKHYNRLRDAIVQAKECAKWAEDFEEVGYEEALKRDLLGRMVNKLKSEQIKTVANEVYHWVDKPKESVV